MPAAEPLVIDRPILVWVTDGVEASDKLADVVFKTEKVALGTKAFRTIRMRGDEAAGEPLFTGKGTEVPRLLLVDASKTVTALEGSKLTGGNLWSAMKKSFGTFFKDDLEAVVKNHLKVLTDLDKASAEDKLLTEKEGRLDPEKDKAEAAKLQKEHDEVRATLEELLRKQTDLWKLTPRTPKAATA